MSSCTSSAGQEHGRDLLHNRFQLLLKLLAGGHQAEPLVLILEGVSYLYLV